jgi:hypothetical protein
MPGELWEDEMPGLYHHAREHLNGPPIYLHLAQAETVLAQFQETATYRTWSLLAVAIMADHWHAVFTGSRRSQSEKAPCGFEGLWQPSAES